MVLTELENAFMEYEEELCLQKLQEALDEGNEPIELVHLLSGQLSKIGELFAEGELFLPDMMMAGDLMEQCMAALQPHLAAASQSEKKIAKVLLGAVKGDIHDIGKNMVKTMLSVSGFEVVDLGTDVSMEQFFNSAAQEKPDIVAFSSCMTTTVPNMQDTLDMFVSRGLEKTYKFVVGGGSTNEETAKKLGNCVYGGRDAFEAVKVCKQMMGVHS